MHTPRRLRRPHAHQRSEVSVEGQARLLPPPGEIGAALALLGLITFVLCYSYERAFYGTFAVSPDDVGQGYAVILGKAATGAALLAALAAPAALSPSLLHLMRRGVRQRIWEHAGAVAVAAIITSLYTLVLGVVADLPLRAAGMTGLLVGLIGGTLSLARPQLRARSQPRQRAWAVVAVGAVFALLVAGAASKGNDDSRELLRTPRATPSASTLQTLLGMNTPAVTLTWTPPGAPTTRTSVGRIIGSADGVLVFFDLGSCTLRRLTGGIAAASRIDHAGLGDDPDAERGSVLPRCPRPA